MFTVTRMQQCLKGLVGFYQPNDPAYPLLDPDLTVANGRYVQDAHPLLTMENLYNIAPEFASFTYPAWQARAYLRNDIVSHNGSVYQSISDDAEEGDVPGISDLWLRVDLFSRWLRQKYNAAIAELAAAVVRIKKFDRAQKSLLESLRVFDGLAMISDRIIKHSRFVGYEIKLVKAEGLQVRVDQVGLQTDTVQDNLVYYLYHSSQISPIGVFPVSLQTATSFTWANLTNALLTHFKAAYDTSGSFYFGYYEDDLLGQALRRTIDLSSEPCSTCNQYNRMAYAAWSKYVSFRAVAVSPPFLSPTRDLFNPLGIEYISDTNWGLNFALTVYCDITELFCTNKALLTDALSMQLGVLFLQEIAFNTRLNAVADKTKALAMSELDESEKSGSFKQLYYKAIKDVSFDFSGQSAACLPCEGPERKGIKRGAV